MTNNHSHATHRINRKAAWVVAGIFLLVSVISGYWIVHRFSPDRRLENYRRSASQFDLQKEWELSIIQWQNVLKLNPNDSEALFRLSDAHLRWIDDHASKSKDDPTIENEATEHFHRAVASLQSLAELETSNRIDRIRKQKACRWLLDFAVRSKNVELAETMIGRLETINPNDQTLAQSKSQLKIIKRGIKEVAN